MKVTIETRSLRSFMRLLEEGVILQVPEGLSVREALVTHFGMDPLYLENRVRTLFLNGKPVDDLDNTRVLHGSVLALSAAMPGLLGATMRRGGYYAAMRQRSDPITQAPETGKASGRVILKLFNMVAQDLREALFKKGFWISGERFQTFLKDQEEVLKTVSIRISADGSSLSFSDLLSMNFGKDDVFLILISLPV